MARPSLEQVTSSAASLLADNTTGEITPLDLRTVIGDLILAVRPAYGTISQAAGRVQALTTTPEPIVCSVGSLSSVVDFSLIPALCEAQRLDPGVTAFTFTADIQGSSNTTRLVTFTLYKNNAPTSWKQTISLSTSTLTESVSMPAIEYLNGNCFYSMKVSCDANYNVTFSNVTFIAESRPIWKYT